MVRKFTRKSLLLLAMLSATASVWAEYETPSEEENEGEVVEVKKEVKKPKELDVDIKFGGKIQEDAWIWQKPLFFGNGPDDAFWYMRSKVDVGWKVKHGEKAYGKPLGEAGVSFGSYTYWQYQNPYTPMTSETVTSRDLAPGVSPVVTGDKHRHTVIVPMAFLKEGWYKLNLDMLTNIFKSFPVSVQAGFFRYEVGRGLSLGYHGDLSHTYAGWEGRSGYSRYPYMPPGVLIRGQMSNNLSIDLYYNKWRSNNADLGSAGMLSPVYANRVDWPTIYRGKDKDRDTFVVKADFTATPGDTGKLLIQPYFTYTRAPELPVEADADSKARLGTVGCMTEWDSSGWNVNVEFAGQFGTQQVFAWDRNVATLARDKEGNVKEVFSHVRLASHDSGDRAIVTNDLRTAVNTAQNRTVVANGQRVNGVANQVTLNGTGPFQLFNSNFWGNPRIRQPFKINYAGLMGMADVAYSFKEIPLKAAVAVAHIGGDRYPFNAEDGSNQPKDKSYKSFIGQRSSYGGKNVESIMLFQQPAILRPINMVNRLLMAENNFLDLSNLQFVGADVIWSPLSSKKLSIKSNVLAFWEVAQLKKWDPNGQHPDPMVRQNFTRMGITGWYSEQNASKFLGVEMNTIINYQLFKNSKFYFKGFMFKPGKLYEDIKGQPNIQGRRLTPTGASFFITQGMELAYGCNAGFEYKF